MSDTLILIIENDRLTSFDLRETLRRLGYRVADPASSGAEGIARATELRPDLVILDIMLEGAPDGIETARRIKRIMDVPVIYITGQTSPQIFRRALETDPHGYLIKPFSTDDLHASIETAMRRSGLERKLRESEVRFRSIIEQSRDSIVLTDEDGVIIEWNCAMEALSGLPRAEAVGRHLWDIIYRFLVEVRKKPERLAQLETRIRGLLRTGTSSWPEGTLENEFQGPDGALHWLEGTLFPIETAKGHMLGYITRDMTERRQYEERLKQSEEKLRLQFKGIPVPTYIWEQRDGELVLVEYNDAAITITDGNIKDYRGITVSRLYANLPEIEADIRRCLAAHETFEREMFYSFQSTGEKKYLIVKYAFLPPDQVLVHTQDITVRKQAEERIRESETRFRLAFENALDAIVWAEAETGTVIHCNRAAEKLFGRDRSEIIGLHQTMLHPPRAEEEDAGGISEACGRKRGADRGRHHHRDGSDTRGPHHHFQNRSRRQAGRPGNIPGHHGQQESGGGASRKRGAIPHPVREVARGHHRAGIGRNRPGHQPGLYRAHRAHARRGGRHSLQGPPHADPGAAAGLQPDAGRADRRHRAPPGGVPGQAPERQDRVHGSVCVADLRHAGRDLPGDLPRHH